jgi:hypothetical protein
MRNKKLSELIENIYKNRQNDYKEDYNKAKSFDLDEIRHVNYMIKVDLSITIFITILINLLKEVFIKLIDNIFSFFGIDAPNIGLYITIIILAIFIAYFIIAVKKQTFKISLLQDLQDDKKKNLDNNLNIVTEESSSALEIENNNLEINNDDVLSEVQSSNGESVIKAMPNKIKHLEMIQGIINRLANNSFTLKNWTITLTVAAITFISKTEDNKYMLIAYFPIVLFWILSTYYLYLENLFRQLYNKIIGKDEKDIDFKMNIKDIENKVLLIKKSILSISQLLFYIASLIIVTLFLKYVGVL